MMLHLAERRRQQTNWKMILNKGAEGNMRQRLDFREAKHAYRQLYEEYADEGTGEGNKSVHPAKQTRQNSEQQFDEHEVYVYTVHPRTGWNIILQQVRLHPRSGNKTMNGGRNKVGIIGDLQPGLNSFFFF